MSFDVPGDPLDRDRFPVDPWVLRERLVPSPADAARGDRLSATLFALANGYLGVRADGDGTRELGHGSFVNGFHETYAIRHAENAYGLAACGQVIQGVPDVAGFDVTCDGLTLAAPVVDRVEAAQHLDFREGITERVTTWLLPEGGRVRVRQRRMVSLTHANLAVFDCEVTPLDATAEVLIQPLYAESDALAAGLPSGMDPRRTERAEGGGLLPLATVAEPGLEIHAYRCRNSRLAMAVGFTFLIEGPSGVHEGTAGGTVAAGESLRVTTLAAYHTEEVAPEGLVGHGLAVTWGLEDTAELIGQCRNTLTLAADLGFDGVLDEQRAWLAAFWERADVRIETPVRQDATQQAVRWALFQLAQVSAQASGHGVPAKGLSGSGYSGHYFWDTEIYVAPFLTYTHPEAARALLEFRHSMLPAARRRAAIMDLDGALFPWRTINGEEASAYYPAGTAQFHIDADVAFAACQYAAIAGDRDFLAGPGVDLLVETARMWVSLGFWQSEGDGLFHLHGVTGPDEYTAVVDDNLYTNVLARFNLRRAAEVLAALAEEDPAAHSAAVERLRVGEDEPAEWRRAAEGMFVPWNADRGIHPQDAHFLSHERWDLAATPAARRPLLLHYHPLVIYRHQVLKQADVVLALLLRSTEFTAAQKLADFDYYDPLTTGDSTLSAVSQAVMAAEVGYGELALRHFERALFIDLADHHGNTADGVHLASAGGIWSVLVCGFGGLRDSGEEPSLDPRLPAGWNSLEFPLTIAGTLLTVRIDPDGVTVEARSGPGLTLLVCGERVTVEAGGHVRVAKPAEALS